MEKTLQQLGELLLNAIPTVVLLLITYMMYRVLVAKPLEQILAKRYELTEGAMQQAKRDIAAADQRTADYEQRLREARASIFKSMEGRRQQAAAIRSAAAAEARTAAQQKVREARTSIQKDADAARTGLQSEAERLSAEIIATILGSAQPSQSAGGQP